MSNSPTTPTTSDVTSTTGDTAPTGVDVADINGVRSVKSSVTSSVMGEVLTSDEAYERDRKALQRMYPDKASKDDGDGDTAKKPKTSAKK